MSDLLSIYKELQAKKWVDLSHQINAESPHFPALPALQQEDLFTLKDGFHVQKITVVGQYGTHIDAPIHFVEGGRWLDEIDLKDLLLPLYVIDKSKEVAANPNFILSKQDILDFEAEHGQIAEGAFVAFRSDWSKRWPDQDAMRNLDENGVQQSPGWSREALEFLIHERHVKAVGHETFDTDAGTTKVVESSLNYYGNAHGGYLFTLCDQVSGLVVVSQGVDGVTLQSSINYLKAGRLGDVLTIHGECVHSGRTTRVVDVDITNQDGANVCKATFTMFVTGQRSDERQVRI